MPGRRSGPRSTVRRSLCRGQRHVYSQGGDVKRFHSRDVASRSRAHRALPDEHRRGSRGQLPAGHGPSRGGRGGGSGPRRVARSVAAAGLGAPDARGGRAPGRPRGPAGRGGPAAPAVGARRACSSSTGTGSSTRACCSTARASSWRPTARSTCSTRTRRVRYRAESRPCSHPATRW